MLFLFSVFFVGVTRAGRNRVTYSGLKRDRLCLGGEVLTRCGESLCVKLSRELLHCSETTGEDHAQLQQLVERIKHC